MFRSSLNYHRTSRWVAAAVGFLFVASTAVASASAENPQTSSPFSSSGAGLSVGPGSVPMPDGGPNFVLDDGTAEDTIGLTAGGQFLWFNRFTPAPADLPFDLTQVEVMFSTLGNVTVGEAVDIYIYTDADGDPSNGATFVGSETGLTIQALDAFSTYTLSPAIPITAAGDVLVLVVNRGSVNAGQFPAAIDETASQGRSWIGFGGTPADPPVLPATTMGTVDSFGFPGNFMIRASGVPAGPAGGDLSILKTGNASPPGSVVYTVSVSNAGPASVTGIVVTDTLPAEVAYVSDNCGGANTPPWTWNVGTLNSGASATCEITTRVVTSGAIVNTATVTADNDTTPDNNASSATVVGVLPAAAAKNVPTMNAMGLGILLAGFAFFALVIIRRRI